MHIPSNIDPKVFYPIVITCPLCGRRTRGNSVLRYFISHPKPDFSDSEYMSVRSAGYRKLKNSRVSLFTMYDGTCSETRPGIISKRITDYIGLLIERALYAHMALKDLRYELKYKAR